MSDVLRYRLADIVAFQAINTVLAFVSSRNNLATTFPAIRSSVEGILKRYVPTCVRSCSSLILSFRPLELSKVAELK